MKALTLTQPWATLVAIGAKRMETRSWATMYRGPLAIHAGKGLAGMNRREWLELCVMTEPFASTLKLAGYRPNELPRAAVVATCVLTACFPSYGFTPASSDEAAFGNFSAGRFVWVLSDVKKLLRPVPARGALGLWEWREE